MTARSQKVSRYFIRYPGAFPSFFDQETELRIRSLIKFGYRRNANSDPNQEKFPFVGLRIARCAEPRPDGKRCGRAVRPYQHPGRADYTAMGCSRWSKPPHSTHAPLSIAEEVVDILKEALDPNRLRPFAQTIQIDGAEVDARRAAMESRQDAATTKLETTATLLLEATTRLRKAEQAKDVKAIRREKALKKRWEDLMSELEDELEQATESLQEAEAQAAEFAAASGGDLARLVDLATNLPALIERSRTVPFALQRIVDALVTRIWIRDFGAGVVGLWVEFPSGVEVHRIVATQGPRGTQPQRLLARMRLEAGVDPDEVAKELLPGMVRPLSWQASHVRGVAVYSEHFDRERREGSHESAQAIAARTGLPVEEVSAVGLKGYFGPARWIDGQLAYLPSTGELHHAIPAAARRDLASRLDLDPAELITGSEVYLANNCGYSDMPWRFAANCTPYQDASGRKWYRASEVLAHDLRVEPDPALDGTAERAAALLEAVRSLGDPSLRVEDFKPLGWLAAKLLGRFAWISEIRIRQAVKEGVLQAVSAPGISRRGKKVKSLRFVFAPGWVIDAQEDRIIRAWLKGARTQPE